MMQIFGPKKLVMATMFLLLIPSLHASEISSVFGILQKQDTEINNGGASTKGGIFNLGAGLRYGDVMEDPRYWFTELGLALGVVDVPDGRKDVSSPLNLEAYYGQRLFLPSLAPNLLPYIGAAAGLKREVELDPLFTSQTETFGLYGKGLLGFRFLVSNEYFFETECTFFESPLFAKQQTESLTEGSDTSSEVTTIGFQVDTIASILDIRLSLGMYL